MSDNPPARYDQLDALRGIAAVSVVFSHFSLIPPFILLRHTPVRFLCGGHEAVLLFFILSGFVLSLQLAPDRKIGYGNYLTRRICRIYFPYLAAVSVGLIIYWLTYRGTVNWAGGWFNSTWRETLSNSSIRDHLIFLAPFQTDTIIPVIWSLVYEMRISIVFPLIVVALYRYSSLSVFGVCCVASFLVFLVFNSNGTDPLTGSIKGNWLITIHYILMFVIGGVIAKHRYQLVAWFSLGNRNLILFSLGATLYLLGRILSFIGSGVFREFLFDWIVTVGAASLMLSAIAWSSFSRALRSGPLPFLGKISFSLYLTHTIVLLGVVHYFYGIEHPLLILILAAILIIPVSIAMYWLFERPSMRLGSFIASHYMAQITPRPGQP